MGIIVVETDDGHQNNRTRKADTMGRDDLLKMLGLGDSPTQPAAPIDPLAASAAPKRGAPPTNPNAMATDEWTDRRGFDLAAAAEIPNVSAADLADFHAAAFDCEPVLRDDCADRRKLDFLAQLMETPEYQALRTSTMLDEAASAVAAVAIGHQFSKAEHDAERDDRKRARRAADLGRPTTKAEAAAEALRDEMWAVRAAGAALATAAAEVKVLVESGAACGMGPGGIGHGLDPDRAARLFRRVRSSRVLSRIMELAGKFRLVARSRQRRKDVHGMDDMVGVTLDGEIARLVPAELARLVLPEAELDTLRRIVERQAMCRDHRSSEPTGKGPIIVAVDTSGSMQGSKIETAKALALSLAWIARHQHRWCGLITFSGDTGHSLLPLPPSGWDEENLLDWLVRFEGGGSYLDIPVREMPDFYRRLGAPAGITDVVFVTDACVKLEDRDRDAFNTWKASVKARLITLVIGTEGGDLSSIADEVHSVPTLDPSGEEVGRVLSL